MSHFKLLMLVLVCFIQGCSWKNNPLGVGSSSSGGDYNTTIGIPPLTPFTINLATGQFAGPCTYDQLILFFSNEICFEITFNREPSSFNASMVHLNQPNSSGILNLNPTADPLVYTLRIQNYDLDGSSDGLFTVTIPADTVTDTFNNPNLEATYSQNSVELSQFVIRQNQVATTSGGTLASDSCQGLNLELWSQTGLSTLNGFFNGSPGVNPSAPLVDGLVDNLLNGDHLEFRPGTANYVMKWTGFIEITTPGNYQFRTRSDDGSRFYINGVLAVNNDGLHGAQTRTSSNINLTSGIHQIELQFFERTGGHIIEFTYSGADTANVFVSPTSAVFQPLNCDLPTALDYSMIDSYWTGVSPFVNALVGIVRDDLDSKHIKVSVDQDQFLKINSSSDVDGSTPLSNDLARVMAAHNNGGLALNNSLGLTSQGNAWTVVDRIWRLECTAGNDLITLQFDGAALNPSVDGIIFSPDQNFNLSVSPFPLTQFGSIKAYSFRCSDLGGSVQYMTLGRYEL